MTELNKVIVKSEKYPRTREKSKNISILFGSVMKPQYPKVLIIENKK